MTPFCELPTRKKLHAHRREVEPLQMRDLFASEPNRFERMSLQLGDLLFDYSKNRATAETLRLLMALAREAELERAIEEMFSGVPINCTEGRAVLHVALRNRSNRPILVEGRDVMPDEYVPTDFDATSIATFHTQRDQDSEQTTAEIRFSSDEDLAEGLTFVAGLFWVEDEYHLDQKTSITAALGPAAALFQDPYADHEREVELRTAPERVHRVLGVGPCLAGKGLRIKVHLSVGPRVGACRL